MNRNIETVANTVSKEYFGYQSQVTLGILACVAAYRADPKKKANVFYYGQPGCGKSTLLVTLRKLMPKFQVFSGSSGLFADFGDQYIAENGIVAFDEANNLSRKALANMRTLLAIDEMGSARGTVKDMKAELVENNKNFSAIMCAVEPVSDEQIMDRFVPVEMVVTQEQRQGVRQMQRGSSAISEQEAESVKSFFTALAETKPQVLTPYQVEAEDTVGNRKFQLLYNLFEAYVLAQHFDADSKPAVVTATEEDFSEFLLLLEQCNVLREDAWSAEKRAVYEALSDTSDKSAKTRKQIMDQLKAQGTLVSDSTVWRILDELKEYISVHPHRREHGELSYYISRPVQRNSKMWIERQHGTEPAET